MGPTEFEPPPSKLITKKQCPVSGAQTCISVISVSQLIFVLITLRNSWGTVYCNRSCLWGCLFVGVCVCGSVTTIIACIDIDQNGSIDEGNNPAD